MESCKIKNRKAMVTKEISTVLSALKKFDDFEIQDPDTVYKIGMNIISLTKYDKEILSIRNDITKKYADLNKQGQPMITLTKRGPSYKFSDDENRKKFVDENEALDEKVIPETVKIFKIKASELKKVKRLKPSIYFDCFPIIELDIEQ